MPTGNVEILCSAKFTAISACCLMDTIRSNYASPAERLDFDASLNLPKVNVSRKWKLDSIVAGCNQLECNKLPIIYSGTTHLDPSSKHVVHLNRGNSPYSV